MDIIASLVRDFIVVTFNVRSKTFNMKNIKLEKFIFMTLLFVNLLHDSTCGICDLCVCTRSEDSRVINCQGNREIDNYTEIFDLLAVDEFKNVKGLRLSKHDIDSLPLDAFRGLRLLELLDLSENSIDHFEANIFKDLNELKELDFSFNQLTLLAGTVFENVQTLLKLNLSNNLITDLKDTTPGQLPKLTHLDLSNNNLQTIDSQFIGSLLSLEFLDVSHNRISSIPSGMLLQLQFLSEFRISDNLLKDSPLYDFPESLTILNLGRNMISSLPQNLTNIRKLNIEDNTIDLIPSDILWLKQMENLNIRGNHLTSFPDERFELLSTLDLSRNNLSNIPKTLSSKNLPRLDTLLIGGNPINDLRFVSELRLRQLIVDNLPLLETIETDTFDKLQEYDNECINLTITKNPLLRQINKGVFSGIAICSLDLSKNAFTHMSPEVVKSKGKFVASNGIDLQGNPFDCDCGLQWILDDFLPHLYDLKPELLEDLRCNTPLPLSGTRMVHWFMWRYQVFCIASPNKLSKLTLDPETVVEGSTVRLESSRGMLAVVAGALGTLCILIITGLMVAHKLGIRKRRMNRRF